jgi:plasmid stabilization system protein ParE
VTYSLRIKPSAEIDLEDAFYFYEHKQSGLGARFLSAVEDSYSKILERPNMYREIAPDVRRGPTRTFPYWVLYTIEAKEILILGVVDSRQDPEYIRAKFDA